MVITGGKLFDNFIHGLYFRHDNFLHLIEIISGCTLDLAMMACSLKIVVSFLSVVLLLFWSFFLRPGDCFLLTPAFSEGATALSSSVLFLRRR